MNGSYYKNPVFQMDPMYERDTEAPGSLNDLTMEQSYIENIFSFYSIEF